MDRAWLQQLARERLTDAESLLKFGRWTGAYYLSGYVVECGLKSCLLKYVGTSSAVFGDKDYLKDLAKCWTHNLDLLVRLSGLEVEFGKDRGDNPILANYWTLTKDWNEASRYETRTETEARLLFDAVTANPNGVFQWLQRHW